MTAYASDVSRRQVFGMVAAAIPCRSWHLDQRSPLSSTCATSSAVTILPPPLLDPALDMPAATLPEKDAW